MTIKDLNTRLESTDTLYNFQNRAKALFDGFPTKNHESWLYWRPEATLQTTLLSPYDGDKAVSIESDADVSILNGRIIKSSEITSLTLSDNPSDLLDKHPMSVSVETSPIATLNSVLFENCIVFHIKDTIERPISVSVRSLFNDEAKSSITRIIVMIEEGCSATISVKHEHDIPETAAVNTFMEVICLKESSLNLTHVFENSKAANFFSNSVHMYAKASCEQVRFIKGSHLSRQDTELNFHEEEASAKLQGVALLSAENQNFNHLKINHHVKDCHCEQNFKTILTDNALSEFSGLVNVKPGAHGTVSTQSNKNLLLSDNARVLSRPQLMIDADDVECGHGSIIGQLNPEEIHYIRSRGMNESEAKALLTLGFAEEILLEIDDESVKKDCIDYVHQKLPQLLSNV